MWSVLCFPCILVFLLGSDIFIDDYIDDSDENDGVESAEENDDEEGTFIQAYSNAMDEQLKPTTLPKTFVGVDKLIPKKDEVFCLGLHQ